MPQPQKKINFRRGFKKWADEKVVQLRIELGLYASSPLCAFRLSEFLNIPILEPSSVQGLTEEQLSDLLGNGSSHWSAATIPLNDGKYIIVHNPTHSPARQQSNLMHELAHILCEHKVAEETKHIGLSGFLRNLNEEQENEAEWLGACLQLPRPALLYSLKKQMSLEEIATKYNASIDMVKYRINITGVQKQIKYFTR
jgi:hypothetical protein